MIFLRKFEKELLILSSFLISVILIYIIFDARALYFGNDLSGNTASFAYIKEALLVNHSFPLWNFYYGMGLPIAGDPLNAFYNPFVFIIFMLFNYSSALYALYFFVFLSSYISIYYLLKYFKINILFSLLLSLTYVVSGYLSARLVAGHLEKLLAYSAIPLFYLLIFSLLKKPSLLKSGLLSLIITYFIFSASIYEAFYSVIIIVSLIIILFINYILKGDLFKKAQIQYLIFSLIFVPFFSALKTFPMIITNANITRSYDPYLGSQNIFSIVYNFFFPYEKYFSLLKLDFYLRIPYMWWENFAFIGPLFTIGIIASLIFYKKIKNSIRTLIYILIIIFSFSMINNYINPFYWIFEIFPIFKEFRIPSRIYIYAVPLVLVLGGIGFDHLFKKFRKVFLKKLIIVLIIVNLIIVFIDFKQKIYLQHLPLVNLNSKNALDYLEKYDNSKFYIAQSVFFQNQLSLAHAISNKQFIYNPNYGWSINNKIIDNYSDIDSNRKNNYSGIYPKYFIYPINVNPPHNFNLNLLTTIDGLNIYRNTSFTPLAYVSDTYKKVSPVGNQQIKNITIKNDEIEINAYGEKNKYLIVTQNYFPGWYAEIDNQVSEINNSGFLSIRMKEGYHNYRFKFHSNLFWCGLIITIVSIGIWIFISSKRVN